MRLLVSTAIIAFVLSACQTTTADNRFRSRTIADEASYTVSSASRIQVVYLSASDCPPCRTYEIVHHPKFTKSPEFKEIEFRKLSFFTYYSTTDDSVWPQDLKWIRTKAYADRGAPRWIVLVDGLIVANSKAWLGQTWPLLQRLVARKSTA